MFLKKTKSSVLKKLIQILYDIYLLRHRCCHAHRLSFHQNNRTVHQENKLYVQQNPVDLQGCLWEKVLALSFPHPLLRLLVFTVSYIEEWKEIHIVHEEEKEPRKIYVHVVINVNINSSYCISNVHICWGKMQFPFKSACCICWHGILLRT